jgi:hypothetical protein
MAKKPARREAELADLQEALGRVYTPGSPIDDPDLFSGRDALLADLRDELPVAGVHLVLYGERGVGKTSLWHVLLHDRRVQEHSASASDDFVSIFLHVLEALGEQFTEDQRRRLAEASISVPGGGPGFKAGDEATEKAVEERRLDLNFVLDRVAGRSKRVDAVVIDEFQNISKQAVQTQIIEVVKGFSDRGANVKIFLVGAADTDDELIPTRDYAQYKGRHFVARRVPRMSNDEVRDILDLREERFGVHFDDRVKDGIVRIASGYPATAQRLALNSAQAWVRRAFLGHSANLFLRVASHLPALGFLSAVSVKKAGVDVEQQDLQRAVTKFLKSFREDHRAVADRYDEALASEHADALNRVLATLAASSTTKLTFEQLASGAGLGQPELRELLKGKARGLVEIKGRDCRLEVRELRTLIEGSRYLAELEEPHVHA